MDNIFFAFSQCRGSRKCIFCIGALKHGNCMLFRGLSYLYFGGGLGFLQFWPLKISLTTWICLYNPVSRLKKGPNPASCLSIFENPVYPLRRILKRNSPKGTMGQKGGQILRKNPIFGGKWTKCSLHFLSNLSMKLSFSKKSIFWGNGQNFLRVFPSVGGLESAFFICRCS